MHVNTIGADKRSVEFVAVVGDENKYLTVMIAAMVMLSCMRKFGLGSPSLDRFQGRHRRFLPLMNSTTPQFLG